MSIPLTGYHAIEETLTAGGARGRLFLSHGGGRVERLVRLACAANVGVVRETDAALDRLCGHRDHRGAVLLLDDVPKREMASVKDYAHALGREHALVLVLDGITDPHNLGAVMRSADQFAVDLLVIPRRRAARETETVARVSAGASAYVPLVVAANLAAELAELKKLGFWVYGAAVDGQSIASVDLRGRTVIVLGSEGKGIGRLVRDRCDGIVSIATRGHVDSFNVSVAAGILMYEVRRQQWE